MMNALNSQIQIVDEFATASEALNDYARTLRAYVADVSTGADIRYYQNGPKLEKWIEARLGKSDSNFCWWLELELVDRDVLISAHISRSHTDYFRELESRRASNTIELKVALAEAVAWLKNQAIDTN